MKHDVLKFCTGLLTHLGHKLDVICCYMTKANTATNQPRSRFPLIRAPLINQFGFVALVQVLGI